MLCAVDGFSSITLQEQQKRSLAASSAWCISHGCDNSWVYDFFNKKKSSCFSQDYLKCDCIQMSRYKLCITCASSLCSVFHFNSHTEKAALCSQDLIHREMKQERILSEKPYFMTTGYMACNLQKGFQEYMPLQILVCNRLLQMVYIDSREFIFNFFINPNTWENPYL